MNVLDASVALKWVLPETDTLKAVRLRTEFRNGIRELISPDIFPFEIAHALAKAERQRIIAQGAGERKLLSVLKAAPNLRPSLPLLHRAYQIASQARIGVWDCLYIALAEREGCDLITADQKLLHNLGGMFPFLVDLATLP
jgi:predicted nucleic acid-binding protein